MVLISIKDMERNYTEKRLKKVDSVKSTAKPFILVKKNALTTIVVRAGVQESAYKSSCTSCASAGLGLGIGDMGRHYIKGTGDSEHNHKSSPKHCNEQLLLLSGLAPE